MAVAVAVADSEAVSPLAGTFPVQLNHSTTPRVTERSPGIAMCNQSPFPERALAVPLDHQQQRLNK